MPMNLLPNGLDPEAKDHQKAREAPSFRAGMQSAGSRSEPLAWWSSFLWHG